jgi:hypothetical protein
MAEGYVVAETVRTGREQIIELPPTVNEDAADAEDLKIIRAEEVKSVAKRHQKLEESLKRGFATVYDQYSKDVQEKLKSTENWETTVRTQSLHKLIQTIERICVQFDDHNQEVFNLVQVLKALFLYTQGEREIVEEYGRNFRSFWDTVEAFGGLPGLHRGMLERLVKHATRVRNLDSPMPDEIAKIGHGANKVVKAALLISGADKRRFEKLKDELANNYLLGTDQYPNTFKKALRILGNYQATKAKVQYRASPNNMGVAFLQRGRGCGGQGRRGGQGKSGAKKEGLGSKGDDVSVITVQSGGGLKTNSRG